MFDTAAKDLRRLRDIVAIIAKYGYAERLFRKSPQLEQQLGPDGVPAPGKVEGGAGPKRFRLMLEELGTTFIKIGQLLSARPDLVSKAYVEELKNLQNRCEPLEFSEIERGIVLGLGAPAETFFRKIEPVSMATASIAQVHRAVTRDGQTVAIKVQRPGIREEIRADLDILYRVAQLFEAVIEESALAEPVGIVRELEQAIWAELNFEIEAANIREFRALRAARESTKDVVIPAVFDALSTDTVLTLEFLDGVPFTRLPADLDTDRKKRIARRVLQEAFDEVFLDGVFHADPHPGNILLLTDGRFGILDFGVCGRITPQMKEALVVLSLAVALKDPDTAARTLYRLGQTTNRVSISELRDDLSSLFSRYLNQRIEDVDSTLLLQELLVLAIKHRIRIPSEYTMLARAGATIEGVVRELDPDLDIAKEAAPYAEQLLLGRVGVGSLQGGLYKALLQFQGLSQDVPIQISQILSDLAAGNLTVNLKGNAVERLNSTLLVATATISASIFGGAFVVGSFIALSGLEWTLFGIPVVAILGGLCAMGIFSWASAYMVVWPRLRKIRLSTFFRRRR